MLTEDNDEKSRERRGKLERVPPELRNRLNPDQSITLRMIQKFGWELAFVRHPIFEPSMPVVLSPCRQRCAIILDDGELELNPGIAVR
jgi:hypothetical protein